MARLPAWMDNLDDKYKRELIKSLEQSVENYSRREILKDMGIFGVGAGAMMAGGSSVVGSASADASTDDDDGDIGTPDNRVDVFADGVDSNSVQTDELSNADIANANIGTVPTAQGDGTLSMDEPGQWSLVKRETPSSDTSEINFTGLSENMEYRLFYTSFVDLSSDDDGVLLRLNGDGKSTGNYTYWDETGSKQTDENEFFVPKLSRSCGTAVSIRITESEFDGEYRTGINVSIMPGNPDRIESWTREGVHDDTGGISSLEFIVDGGKGFNSGETLFELWERDYSGN